jgi:hypothetical protein
MADVPSGPSLDSTPHYANLKKFKASTHTGQYKQRKTQISVPRVGFEPTNPVVKLAKSVHALDQEATVIGSSNTPFLKLKYEKNHNNILNTF